jgi:hypothetical protein
MFDTGVSQGCERAKGFGRLRQEVANQGRDIPAFFVGAALVLWTEQDAESIVDRLPNGIF